MLLEHAEQDLELALDDPLRSYMCSVEGMTVLVCCMRFITSAIFHVDGRRCYVRIADCLTIGVACRASREGSAGKGVGVIEDGWVEESVLKIA